MKAPVQNMGANIDVSLLYIILAKKLLHIMPNSRAMNIVETAGPLDLSEAKSMVQAKTVGEFMPAANPQTDAATISIVCDVLKPIKIMPVIKNMDPIFNNTTLPHLSEALPDSNRETIEDISIKEKNKPLFSICK